MESLTLLVPTYYGIAYPDQIEKREIKEFADPHVPILVYREEGVRIVLGADDNDNLDVPDINIERRPRGWAIFMHPLGGSDPSAYVYFLDDGRSFLVKESGLGPTPEIEIVHGLEEIPDLDSVPDGSNHALPRSVESLPIEEALELVSEIRSMAFGGDGPEDLTEGVKKLLKRYRLEPRLKRRTPGAMG